MCGGRVGLTSLDAVCKMSSVTCVNAHVWYKIKKKMDAVSKIHSAERSES